MRGGMTPLEKNRAKAYLWRIRKIEKDIRNIEDMIRDAREEQETIRSAWPDGQPHGTGTTDPTAQAVIDLEVKIGDYERKLIRDKSDLWKAKMDILDTISKVRDANLSRLLYLFYIDGKTWEEVAVELHYSYRHTTRRHGRALQEVDKILDQKMSYNVPRKP